MGAAGLDIGTTTICAVLLDEGSGRLIKAVSRQNTSNISAGRELYHTQSPRVILETAQEILSELSALGLSSIGVTGQMHGMLYLDGKGGPLSPLYTWLDGRANEPYCGGSYCERLGALTGYHMAAGYGLATHYYNVLNGLVPSRAAAMCTIGDYIACALCGADRPSIHPSNAHSMGAFDIAAGGFDLRSIERSGLDPGLLPEVKGEEVVGLTRSNIPVCNAVGDNQSSVFGCLGTERGVVVNVGTGAQVSMVCGDEKPGGEAEERPYVGGRRILSGAALCGGRAFGVLRDFMEESARLLGFEPPDDIYGRLCAAAEQAKVGLTVDTRFCGTRKDPGLRGSITGVGVDNFTPGSLALGVLEGVVRELYGIYRSMPGTSPETLIASGNAVRKNRLMRALIAGAFDTPLKIPEYCEEAACGAALIGMAAAGKKSLEQAGQLIKYINIDGGAT